MRENQSGLGLIVIALFIGVFGFIAAAGYVVYQKTRPPKSVVTLSGAGSPAGFVHDFDSCVAAGNAVMESSPEQCRDRDGKHYVNDASKAKAYIDIKEWGVRFQEVADGDAFYTYSFNSDDSAVVTLYSNQADTIRNSRGVSCKGEYILYVSRQLGEHQTPEPLFDVIGTVEGNTYSYATKKQYGPECLNDARQGEDYMSNEENARKFEALVKAYAQKVTTLEVIPE